MRLAKMYNDTIIQIIRVSDRVQFATGTWILTCIDWETPPHKQQQFKWLTINTKFQWVKDFVDANTKSD
jgi:hypothetical protein